jgi:DNA-binding NarL/FixJ family response regulator
LPPIRVLLAAKHRILNDIFAAILAPSADVVIVGTVTARNALVATVLSTEAEVVMMDPSDVGEIAFVTELLYVHPRLKVLATMNDGRGTVLCELQPNQTTLGDLSAEHLLDAIRAVARPGAA